VPPTIINTPASETAFPYLTTTKVVTGVEHSLQVAWNALQIPRQI